MCSRRGWDTSMGAWHSARTIGGTWVSRCCRAATPTEVLNSRIACRHGPPFCCLSAVWIVWSTARGTGNSGVEAHDSTAANPASTIGTSLHDHTSSLWGSNRAPNPLPSPAPSLLPSLSSALEARSLLPHGYIALPLPGFFTPRCLSSLRRFDSHL